MPPTDFSAIDGPTINSRVYRNMYCNPVEFELAFTVSSGASQFHAQYIIDDGDVRLLLLNDVDQSHGGVSGYLKLHCAFGTDAIYKAVVLLPMPLASIRIIYTDEDVAQVIHKITENTVTAVYVSPTEEAQESDESEGENMSESDYGFTTDESTTNADSVDLSMTASQEFPL
jgi:hypothetical protein